MRLAGWLRLTALGLLAAVVGPACAPAAAPDGPAPRAKVAPRGDFEPPRGVAPAQQPAGSPAKFPLRADFEGYGPGPKDAEANALEDACAWLARHHAADLGWVPTPDYLRDKNLVRFDEPADAELEKAGRVKKVVMHLEVNAEQARAMQKLGQVERMQQRQRWALLGILGVAALAAVVGGYLRLEEATKGYFTRRLRLAAVLLLVVVAVLLGVMG